VGVSKVYGNRWRVVEPLGRGGQAIVYKVEDLKGVISDEEALELLKASLRDATRVVHHVSDHSGFPELIGAIRRIAASVAPPVAALKHLHPEEEAINPAIALDRMKREFEAMQSVSHAALIRALDANLNDRWFVTDYFRWGSFRAQLQRYKGQVLPALVAFRPVVEAVALLHAKRIVHRDIKPQNIFVADDGRLVLGDCGLAIRLDAEERLTDTYERVGSSDWMPGWAMTKRLEDVTPAFDVFCLGKVLWAMVSGKPALLLWYHNDPHHPELNLRGLFPDLPDVAWIARILAKTVVQREAQCLPTAHDLLPMVDHAIAALQRGCQLPGLVKKLRCRFCSYGVYERFDDIKHSFRDPHDEMHYYRCNFCGHVEAFLMRHIQRQPAWDEKLSD
jgi:serine/threonine protein kinase